LLDDYSQADPARAQRKSDSWENHETVLLRSAFASLERVSIVERRRVTLDSLISRAQSMSSLSRERLGPRLDELLERVRELLETHAADGWLEERVESSAVIARR
jgi:hypothetical protein